MSNENVVVLDPKDLRRPSRVTVGSTEISATPSPYDIPEAVRTYENPRDGTYVIEVQYIGAEEPYELTNVDTNLQVRTGRNSKRLYGFVMHPGSGSFTKSNTLGVLEKAVNVLISRDAFPRKENYRLFKMVLNNVGIALVDRLIPGSLEGKKK